MPQASSTEKVSLGCPRDTDGDGHCGKRYCPWCGISRDFVWFLSFEWRRIAFRDMKRTVRLGQRWGNLSGNLLVVVMPHHKDRQARIAMVFEHHQQLPSPRCETMSYLALGRDYSLVVDRNA